MKKVCARKGDVTPAHRCSLGALESMTGRLFQPGSTRLQSHCFLRGPWEGGVATRQNTARGVLRALSERAGEASTWLR